MARQEKLTDAKIRDMEARDKPYFVPVPGSTLKVRVMPGGTKAYYLRWRVKQADGSLKQIGSVIGYPPGQGVLNPLGLDEAVAKAHLLIAYGKKGEDPRPVWEAEEKKARQASQTEQMEALGTTDPENLEFLKSAWMNYYNNERTDLAKRHKAKMLGCWRHVVAHLDPNIRTRDITDEHVDKVKRNMKSTPAEFDKFFLALYGVLKFEVSSGRLKKNILRGMDKNPPKYRMTILNETGIRQFQEFYSNMENFAPIDQPHARFFLGLLYTGMRPKTLRTLQREDNGENNFVDWRRGDHGLIVIRKDKTSDRRNAPFVPVPITAQAAAVSVHESRDILPYGRCPGGLHGYQDHHDFDCEGRVRQVDACPVPGGPARARRPPGSRSAT